MRVATRLHELGLIAALTLQGGPAAADDLLGDSAKGQAIFESVCVACHALDRNRVGPRLGGVIGRPAGSVPDFNYSQALREAGFVWDEALVERWLTNPQALLPGQRMNIRVSQAQNRADVIAYLKTTAGD